MKVADKHEVLSGSSKLAWTSLGLLHHRTGLRRARTVEQKPFRPDSHDACLSKVWLLSTALDEHRYHLDFDKEPVLMAHLTLDAVPNPFFTAPLLGMVEGVRV